MCCKSFWKRIIPFILTLMFGLLAVNYFQKESVVYKSQENVNYSNKIIISKRETGSGLSGSSNFFERKCFACKNGILPVTKSEINKRAFVKKYDESQILPLKVISKPKANYTDSARTNQIQGIVRLRVTFTAAGTTENIVPVSGLPFGLTEQAIAAARQIRFEPAKRNGQPIASTKIVEYSFTIY